MQYRTDLVESFSAMSPTNTDTDAGDDDRPLLFSGTVGSELNIVAFESPSAPGGFGSPAVSQEDKGILIDLNNFSGRIRISSVFPHNKEIQLVFERDNVSQQPAPEAPLKNTSSILRIDQTGAMERVSTRSPRSPRFSPRGRKRASVAFKPPPPLNDNQEPSEHAEDPDFSIVGQGDIDLSKLGNFGSKHWADHSFRPQDAREGQTSATLPQRGLVRERSNYSDWDPNESDYASALHEACDSPFATTIELEDALHYHPEAVSKQDQDGRLPLHILASNIELIGQGGEAGREMATNFAKKLMKAYPNGVLTADNAGHIPFTDTIQQWIEWTYESDKGNDKASVQASEKSAKSSKKLASRLLSKMKERSERRKNPSGHVARMESHVEGGTLAGGSLKKFPLAEITEEVDWCFDMLSVGMDLSGGKTASGVSRPLLSYKKQLLDRERLAAEIASIPLLLKTIFLLESNTARHRILKTSIVRRVILSPESVGPWVTSMLRYRPIPSRLAVDYFELISNVSVEDYIGDFRKPSPGDFEEFRSARETVYDEVMELGGTIPSLVVLDEKEIERAASTRAIYYVMSKSLTQPLVVALVVTDFVMQITLMLAFRGFVRDEETARVSQELYIGGNQVIIIIGCYLLFREIMNVIALARISLRVLVRHITDPWILMDMAGICLALASSFLYVKEGWQPERGMLRAVTLGLLWFRLLSFLKIVNERTATFILALVQIMRDMRYFLVVFTAVILLFSDMLFIIYNHNREELCEGENISGPSQDYCSDQPYNAYLRTYAIILGDIDIHDYREKPSITIIFVLITFIAFIILLNVLIAVLSFSYDTARRQSAILFRRARIEFVASHTALESLLRPKKREKKRCGGRLYRIFLMVVGRLILFAMLGSSVVAMIFLVTSSYSMRDDGQENLFLVVLYAIMTLVLWLGGVWGVTFFIFGTLLQDLLPSYAANMVAKIDSVIQGCAIHAARWLFGLGDPCGGESFDGEDDLKYIGDDDDIAQLQWIRRELHKTEKSLRDQVRHTEERLRREVEALNPSKEPQQTDSRRASVTRASFFRAR